MPLDLTKPVQTRDGTPVRILCTDADCISSGALQPIVGLVPGLGSPLAWCTDGRYMSERQHDLDLVNIPPQKKKVTVEVRLWQDNDGTVRSLSNIMITGNEWDRYLTIRWLSTSTVEMEYEEDQT